MPTTVGLSREELIDKFGEARLAMFEPEAIRRLSLFPKLYQSEELNEAIKLIEAGLQAILIVIYENNEAIAKSLNR